MVSLVATRSSFQAGTPKEITIFSVADKAPAFKTDKLSQIKLVTYSKCTAAAEFDPNYIQSGDELSVLLIKGALPKGISAKVSGQKLKFTGKPTVAGSYTAYFRACATRNGKLVKGMPLRVSFRVVDPTTVKSSDKTYGHLANTAVKTSRTISSMIVLTGGDPSRLTGTLDVTIPKTGKLSAKYLSNGGTVSFTATGWDAKNFADADGTLTATLTPSKAGYALTVKARPNGRVEAIVADKNVKDQELSAKSIGKVWSSSASAKAWVGIYNGALAPARTPYYLGDGQYGAFTGDISADMIAHLGCSYVIIGHSERRKYHPEDDANIVDQVRATLAAGMRPILCVGESFEERRQGIELDFAVGQVRDVTRDLNEDEAAKLIVAYEPVWAIGTGMVATPDSAQDAAQAIRADLRWPTACASCTAVP